MRRAAASRRAGARALLVLGLVAFALGSGSAASAKGQRDVLRFGRIATSGTPLAIIVAERQGYFARQKLDVRIVDLGGVHHQVEALDRGEVDIAHTATPYLIQAVVKGSNAAGVVGGPANVIYSLMAKPEVKAYGALRGKVVGVSLPQDTISITTRKMLAAQGLVEGRDYSTTVRIGPARVACLRSGECDAVATNSPTDLALASQGFTKLGDSLPVIPHLQFNLLAARRDWARAHRGEVVRFARAVGEAYRYMRAPANREAMVALVVEQTKVSAEVARQMLRGYYDPDSGVMPRHAEIDLEGVRTVIVLLQESGELKGPAPKAGRFVDLSYLKAAGLQ